MTPPSPSRPYATVPDSAQAPLGDVSRETGQEETASVATVAYVAPGSPAAVLATLADRIEARLVLDDRVNRFGGRVRVRVSHNERMGGLLCEARIDLGEKCLECQWVMEWIEIHRNAVLTLAREGVAAPTPNSFADLGLSPFVPSWGERVRRVGMAVFERHAAAAVGWMYGEEEDFK